MLEYSRIVTGKKSYHRKLICRIGEDANGLVHYIESHRVPSHEIAHIKSVLISKISTEERLKTLRTLAPCSSRTVLKTHKSRITSVRKYDI